MQFLLYKIYNHQLWHRMIERHRNRKQNKKEDLFGKGVTEDKPASVKELRESSVCIREIVVNYYIETPQLFGIIYLPLGREEETQAQGARGTF